MLALNSATWLAALQVAIASGDAQAIKLAQSRYNHKEIKDRLIEETSAKCAYCESKILHVSPGDIEHVQPKSADVTRTFQWDNLTLSCSSCNNNKRNHSGVVDPYNDVIGDHFQFLGPMMFPVSANTKAVFTERQLKLNRLRLVEQRMTRLSAVSTQIQLIVKTSDDDLKQVLIEDLVENDCADDAEYSAFAKALVTSLLPAAISGVDDG
ncbi:HNH endonuclease [Sphingomonas sp. BK235]|uniref:HNH endonuclease n=1 Tax=Sphingomonas sp. BK235 TaxID=2512131 RepID=UPI001404ED1E|nr:HNH endonuclease [Sphingomonas sp. BK235]